MLAFPETVGNGACMIELTGWSFRKFLSNKHANKCLSEIDPTYTPSALDGIITNKPDILTL